MSVDPTQIIKIYRDTLPGDLDPLEFSARLDGRDLGIVTYQPPAMLPDYGYMVNHPDVDGSELTSVRWQQALLNFDWLRVTATTEAEIRAAYAEVLEAIAPIRFRVGTIVNDAEEEIWIADRGAMTPGPRDLVSTRYLCPVYSVAIPVNPIPGAP